MIAAAEMLVPDCLSWFGQDGDFILDYVGCVQARKWYEMNKDKYKSSSI